MLLLPIVGNENGVILKGITSVPNLVKKRHLVEECKFSDRNNQTQVAW
jgi:hypothetical protein